MPLASFVCILCNSALATDLNSQLKRAGLSNLTRKCFWSSLIWSWSSISKLDFLLVAWRHGNTLQSAVVTAMFSWSPDELGVRKLYWSKYTFSLLPRQWEWVLIDISDEKEKAARVRPCVWGDAQGQTRSGENQKGKKCALLSPARWGLRGACLILRGIQQRPDDISNKIAPPHHPPHPNSGLFIWCLRLGDRARMLDPHFVSSDVAANGFSAIHSRKLLNIYSNSCPSFTVFLSLTAHKNTHMDK